MKKLFYLTAYWLLASTAHAQYFEWAKRLGGTSFDQGRAIAVDEAGNVYTTGSFQGTVDFDPGPGTFNLTAAATSDDIFISKLDADGNFVWAKRIGGTGVDRGLAIAVDGAGSVYTTGYFTGIVDFDPGPGTFIFTSAGSNDIFVAKLNAEGNFVWAKRMGGTENDIGNDIALDGAGNVYTTGQFVGTVDFDPGPGTFNLTATAGSRNVFVSKLDANGNFVWARRMGGPVDVVGRALALDGAGHVYTTGQFRGTVDFDPGPGTFNLISAGSQSQDIFVSKLNTNGNFIWAKRMGGTGFGIGYALALDEAGHVYTTGSFSGTADFDPGPGTFNLAATGDRDVFISKLDANGNFQWAKRMGGASSDAGDALALDGAGHVYTTGSFRGTVDFDPGPGTFNLISGGGGAGWNIFISKLDANGDFVWAQRMGGTGSAGGSALTLDGTGNVYSTGIFSGTADFDPGPGLFNLTSAGLSDIFISKLSQSPVRLADLGPASAAVVVYPNPSTGLFYVRYDGAGSVPFTLRDLLGKTISTGSISSGLNPLHLEAQAAGVYFLQMPSRTLRLVRQ